MELSLVLLLILQIFSLKDYLISISFLLFVENWYISFKYIPLIFRWQTGSIKTKLDD